MSKTSAEERLAPPPDDGRGELVVRAVGITRRFPGVLALDDVDIELRAGEIHALAGENGSGKSTLAKILYGALEPDGGHVEIDGQRVELGSPAAALKHRIVAISQELTLASTLSVTENVLMGRLPRRRSGLVDWPAARRNAREALDRLGVDIDELIRVDRLSVELQQEVEIARAVSANSRVLILDEATSSLSEAATEQLLRLVERLRKQGTSILLISHRLKELYRSATRVTVLRDGRLAHAGRLSDTPEEALVRSMVGRDISDLYGRRRISKGEIVLSVRDLHTPRAALLPSSLEIRAGEILGVAGLVGSGKSELAMALGGGVPASGEVRVRGQLADVSTPQKAVASGIGLVPDDRKRSGIFPTMSVRQNLSMGWLDIMTRGPNVIDAGRERQMTQEAISRFGIRAGSPEALITTLSGGNQQKVLLGRWFARSLDVLVLNEPTRGIDVGAKSEVYRLLQEAAQQGRAILMVSSELPELLGLTDRILVMFQGAVCGEFGADATEAEVAQIAVAGARP